MRGQQIGGIMGILRERSIDRHSQNSDVTSTPQESPGEIATMEAINGSKATGSMPPQRGFA